MRELFLLRGLPGSGKSTIARLFVRSMFPLINPDLGGISVGHFSADGYFETAEGYKYDVRKQKEAHRYCEAGVLDAMENDCHIIFVHNTFTREWEMEKYFNMAKEHDYRVHVLTVENWHGSANLHNVSDRKIREMGSRYELKLGEPNREPLQELIKKLDHVEQTPEWHPEGNVGIHTALVTGYLLLAYPSCTELHWTGLFHDMGKIDTTQWNDEREVWTAYGHDKVSVSYFRDYLDVLPRLRYDGFDLDFEQIEWLIANHMRFKQLDKMGEEKALKLQGHKWYNHLAAFGQADNMKWMFAYASEQDRRGYIDAYHQWLESYDLLWLDH